MTPRRPTDAYTTRIAMFTPALLTRYGPVTPRNRGEFSIDPIPLDKVMIFFCSLALTFSINASAIFIGPIVLVSRIVRNRS